MTFRRKTTFSGIAGALIALLSALNAPAQVGSAVPVAREVEVAIPEPPNPTIIRPSEDPERTGNGLALTPPMGWNSWNKFGCNVNETLVRAAADSMVATGMRAAGYQYVVIDDCWQVSRDTQGTLVADPVRFPSGMKALASYIHSKGLKLGIYSDAGNKTCRGRPGSQGREYQDAGTFAQWGVDCLKYDWCWTGVRKAEEAYAVMADALRSTGRDIVLSICEWGKDRPWEWGPRIGNLWRTTSDIRNAWAGRVQFQIGVIDIVDVNEPLYAQAGPGPVDLADQRVVLARSCPPYAGQSPVRAASCVASFRPQALRATVKLLHPTSSTNPLQPRTARFRGHWRTRLESYHPTIGPSDVRF